MFISELSRIIHICFPCLYQNSRTSSTCVLHFYIRTHTLHHPPVLKMFIIELSHDHHSPALYMSISELAHIIHLVFFLHGYNSTLTQSSSTISSVDFYTRTLIQALFTYFFTVYTDIKWLK